MIITDFLWVAREFPTSFISGRVLVAAVVSRKTDGTGIAIVFRSTPVNMTSDLAASGALGGGDHMTAGARVGPGRVLCGVAFGLGATGSNSNSLRSAEVYGYLVNR